MRIVNFLTPEQIQDILDKYPFLSHQYIRGDHIIFINGDHIFDQKLFEEANILMDTYEERFFASKEPPEIKWEEIKGKEIRSFKWGDEPYVLYIIPHREDEYIVLRADAFDQETGQTYIMSYQHIKDKFEIDLNIKPWNGKKQKE